ncbi:MAG: flagellar hook assembly protein FlgD [Pseudomonadota bacterium]
MLDIDAVESLGLGQRQPTVSGGGDELGQDEFLTLMLEQFRNQDPLKPQESGDFLGQLAQFGTVSGIEELQDSINSLATSLFSDQALQASNLVGRNVLAPSSFGIVEEGQGLTGAIEVPETTPSVSLRIVDAAGGLVREFDLGANPRGLVRFSWDGLDSSGQPVPPGVYSLSAQSLQLGAAESAPVFVDSLVESVSFGGDGQGVVLNVRGVGEMSLNDVRQIS